jgi:hypothetical protein
MVHGGVRWWVREAVRGRTKPDFDMGYVSVVAEDFEESAYYEATESPGTHRRRIWLSRGIRV